MARGADRDDLLGDGALGLIRAVDTYDPLRGATLEAYARKLIAGAMLNGLRKLDPVSERVRRDAPLCPLLWIELVYVYNGALHGLRPETVNSDFWNVYDWTLDQ